MKSVTFLIAPIAVLSIASCIPTNKNKYDTSDPYGYPDASAASAPAADASAANSNPLYDTPAVYDNHAPAPDAIPPLVEPEPSTKSTAKSTAKRPATPSAPSIASSGASITHTVARGDTLSKISAKYKVSTAAIKKANHMTSDVVVLGRKLIIPTH